MYNFSSNWNKCDLSMGTLGTKGARTKMLDI